MKIITGGRRYGKTTALRDWVLEAYEKYVAEVAKGNYESEFRIAVVVDQGRRDQLLFEIRSIYTMAPDHIVVTYEDVERGRLRGRGNFVLGLDDLEQVINRVTNGLRVGMITLTIEGEDHRCLVPEPWNTPDYGDFPMNVGESLTPSGSIG